MAKLCVWIGFILAPVVSGAQAQPVARQTDAQAPQQHGRPSPADFAEPSFLSDPELSPDGRKLVIKRHQGNLVQLAVFEVGKWDVPIREVKLDPGMFLRKFSWAADDLLLISVLALPTAKPFRLPGTRLLAYTVSTGRSVPLDGGGGIIGDSIVFVDPGGRYVLLATQKSIFDYPGVDRIDLSTGASQQIQKPRDGVTAWFADPGGVIRAGVDYSQGKAKIHYRTGPEAPWQTMKVSTQFGDDSVIEAIRFASDPGSGVIVTNGATGRFGAYYYDFTTQTYGAPIFQHPEVDLDSVIMNGSANVVEGVTYEDDRPHTLWLNTTLAAVQDHLDRLLSGRTNKIIDRSKEGNRILFESSSPSDPGGYYLYDRAAKRIDLFATPYDRIDPKQLSEARSVRFAARDGLTIRAYLTMPKKAPKGALPLILMPHGGPFSRDHWQYDPLVQFLASRGYAVLQPQFRGSTGFGRQFVESGYGQIGLNMQDDLDDAVDWAAREGFIDPKRVCILGGSYGGYAAMWAAIRNPERYRCAVSIAGISDLRAMVKYDTQLMIPRRYAPQWRKIIAGDEKRDLAAVSPLQQAARLKVPLMLVHGELDHNVPVDQSKKMEAALRKGGAPVEAVYYPKEGHGITSKENMTDLLTRLEAFLGKHNPA